VDSGNQPGLLVYNAVSPTISRNFRQLPEIHRLSSSPKLRPFRPVSTPSPAAWVTLGTIPNP
jgi:hypothetical protein